MLRANTTIRETALQAISLIENPPLRNSLEHVYSSTDICDVLDTVQSTFDRFVSRQWNADTLAKFIAGWSATHGTVIYVGGMIIRILREAQAASDRKRDLLFSVAHETAEVIPEDTGVDDIPHHELFSRFGEAVVGDDRWKLNQYSNPECDHFRNLMKHRRLQGPIDEALLFTAASEHWNTGEFEYFNSVLPVDMDSLPGTRPIVGLDRDYLSHHCGDTELGHFLHMIRAWTLYCEAHAICPDPSVAGRIFTQYALELKPTFEAINKVLDE
jgi:hypothetical protein